LFVRRILPCFLILNHLLISDVGLRDGREVAPGSGRLAVLSEREYESSERVTRPVGVLVDGLDCFEIGLAARELGQVEHPDVR